MDFSVNFMQRATVVLTVLFSVFTILTYICTLGGFKFHVLASDEDISIEVDEKYAIQP